MSIFPSSNSGSDDVSNLGIEENYECPVCKEQVTSGFWNHYQACIKDVSCIDCGIACDQKRMAAGEHRCEHCYDLWHASEDRDGGPFTVVIWELESYFTKSRVAREYEFPLLSEAEQFGRVWQGKVTNVYGTEVFNFEKK